jgi:transcriptional regulator with XRE-family HTH domain
MMSISEVDFSEARSEGSLSDLIASRLRTARTLRGWSQKELARHAGIPAKTIAHYEIGLSKPSLEVLRRLVGLLEVTTDYLLGIADDPDTEAGDSLFRAVGLLADDDRELMRDFLKVLVQHSQSKRNKKIK